MHSPTLRLAAIAGLFLLAACSKPEAPEAAPSLTVSVAIPQRDTIVRTAAPASTPHVGCETISTS
ncbi:MAG TPA: hypothetical protein PLO34_07565, partial [Pseudoxanthomonas sp.]|nr:hypothetical protein [Pseudoxanthomonas sp.]